MGKNERNRYKSNLTCINPQVLGRSFDCDSCNRAEILPCENILCSKDISEKGANCRLLMESARIKPVSIHVLSPTYFIHMQQNTYQANKNAAPPNPREGHFIYHSSIILYNLPIRHGPGQFSVMSDLLNIMGFLFPVPNPQRISQNIPDTDQRIPRDGHQVKAGRLI